MTNVAAADITADRTLLIVDQDNTFLQPLVRAVETLGFAVTTVDTLADALCAVEKMPPAFAIVDVRLADGNGLDVISALTHHRPDARCIVLTSHGNIASAVNAVKLGAVDYFPRPADTDEVIAALLANGAKKAASPKIFMSPDDARWEHILRIYELCGRNVAETARRLKMHRRTLQRILSKRMR